MRFNSTILILLVTLRASATTVAELQARNELLQIRSNVNFLSSCVVICIVMIFFMWGIRERNKKHLMMLQRKNNALQRTNRLVEEARDKAEHESKMKTVFISNLSHEIRTPLHQMLGFIQLLNDEEMPLDEESRCEMTKYVADGCEQLMRVVDNISEVTEKLNKLDRLSDVESVLKSSGPQDGVQGVQTGDRQEKSVDKQE